MSINTICIIKIILNSFQVTERNGMLMKQILVKKYLYFQTAWDTPLPIFEKLVELNSDTCLQMAI